jgi:hypothetical protein
LPNGKASLALHIFWCAGIREHFFHRRFVHKMILNQLVFTVMTRRYAHHLFKNPRKVMGIGKTDVKGHFKNRQTLLVQQPAGLVNAATGMELLGRLP